MAGVMENGRSILFACSVNGLRSPMAEAMARALLPGARIASAGVDAAAFVDGFAVAVMREKGFDISDHHPRSFEDLGPEPFDLVISLSPDAHHRARALTRAWNAEYQHWATPDPSGQSGTREMILEDYRKVRDSIEKRLVALLSHA
jgi:protein-tyrosine-phosphatase